jgi:hypothetical protein
MSQGRIITLPRDAFHYALLLKNIAQLSLCILDNQVNGLKLEEELEGDQFIIEQNESSGAFYVANYFLTLNDEPIEVYIPLHSRHGWVLKATYKGEDYEVFDEKGNFIANFEASIPVG